MATQLGVEHRLEQGTQQQAVVGGEQVDRGPHHHRAHQGSRLDEVTGGLGVERREARPQREVRVARDLRLQADQVVDGLEWSELAPLQQQLAGERGPPEGATGQGAAAHASDLGWSGGLRSSR